MEMHWYKLLKIAFVKIFTEGGMYEDPNIFDSFTPFCIDMYMLIPVTNVLGDGEKSYLLSLKNKYVLTVSNLK